MGVELAYFHGFREVILEGDFEIVIKAIQLWPQKSNWRIHSLVQEIRAVCCRLQSWQAVHVYRGPNELVQDLARWAAAEFSSVCIPCSCEHSLNLSWLYASSDPPQSRAFLVLNSGIKFGFD